MAVSIDAAYSWAISACNNSTVGYSQTYRNQQTVNGITYYDCSSFIWYALIAGGFDVVNTYGSREPFTTVYMNTVLLNLGFTRISITSSTVALAGDIVWKDGHTEMVYRPTGTNTAWLMGAHSSQLDLADQVSIRAYDQYLTNYTYIYRYGENGATQGYSYSPYAVAAMCGNFWMESHADPGIWESLSTTSTWTDLLVGYGLGQWTNTNGDTTGRLYQLYSYLISNGYSVDDGYGQLEFLLYENVWLTSGSNKEYAQMFSSLQDFLTTTSTDIETLTYAYFQGWEGIWNGTQTERAEYAQKAYDYVMQHMYDDNITHWITGNRYLSESEYLNNCVLIFRYLCMGWYSSPSSDSGKRRGKKKGIKVWQMLPWWKWIRVK